MGVLLYNKSISKIIGYMRKRKKIKLLSPGTSLKIEFKNLKKFIIAIIININFYKFFLIYFLHIFLNFYLSYNQLEAILYILGSLTKEKSYYIFY